MTDKDAILAQFFEQYQPPAYDARFVAAALARARRKRNAGAVLWVGVGSLIAMVLAFAGSQIGSAYTVMGPAVAPIAVIATVLFMTRRMLWARA